MKNIGTKLSTAGLRADEMKDKAVGRARTNQVWEKKKCKKYSLTHLYERKEFIVLAS